MEPITFPVFDGHNDTLRNLYLPKVGGGRSFLAHSLQGHLDLPRARVGGFAGGFFAIQTPLDASGENQPQSDFQRTPSGYEMRLAPPVEPTYALTFTLGVFASMLKLEAHSAGALRLVRTVAQLESCLADGVLAVVVHLEGAEAIASDLDALYVLRAAGLRSLGIVWSRANCFGAGVPFAFPRSPDTGPGLTSAGRELVRACNALGVLLDLAHLNERGFWDVAGLSDAPLVVTHAGVHRLCPSTRNLTDAQLDAIGASDGVVGIIFDVTNLREDGDLNRASPLSLIARHVVYVADRLGVEHVALGSDFDGCDVPNELGDVTGLPRLIAELRTHGFDEAALRKITSENWLRVLRRTWK